MKFIPVLTLNPSQAKKFVKGYDKYLEIGPNMAAVNTMHITESYEMNLGEGCDPNPLRQDITVCVIFTDDGSAFLFCHDIETLCIDAELEFSDIFKQSDFIYRERRFYAKCIKHCYWEKRGEVV